jgi:membrane protein YdbS with pleckstrin-like domain
MKLSIKLKNKKIDIGYGIIIFAVLVILKVTSILNISWFWVLCPIWIPIVSAIVILASAIFKLCSKSE